MISSRTSITYRSFRSVDRSGSSSRLMSVTSTTYVTSLPLESVSITWKSGVRPLIFGYIVTCLGLVPLRNS